jgi:hypothetical protein
MREVTDGASSFSVVTQEADQIPQLADGAFRALNGAGYIEVVWASHAAARVTDVSGEARPAVGSWPNAEQYVDGLIHALEQREQDTSDEAERTRLRRTLDAIGRSAGMFWLRQPRQWLLARYHVDGTYAGPMPFRFADKVPRRLKREDTPMVVVVVRYAVSAQVIVASCAICSPC